MCKQSKIASWSDTINSPFWIGYAVRTHLLHLKIRLEISKARKHYTVVLAISQVYGNWELKGNECLESLYVAWISIFYFFCRHFYYLVNNFQLYSWLFFGEYKGNRMKGRLTYPILQIAYFTIIMKPHWSLDFGGYHGHIFLDLLAVTHSNVNDSNALFLLKSIMTLTFLTVIVICKISYEILGHGMLWFRI